MRNVILQGDAWQLARTLPDNSVNCIVTSPPYFGLRDYGDPEQFGVESTPEEYVAKLVALFRELRRALRDDGTVFLNLGDSYAANRGYQVVDNKYVDVGNNRGMTVPQGLKPKDLIGIPWRVAFALQADGWWLRQDIIWSKKAAMPESVTDRCTKAHEYVFLLSKSANYHYDAEAIKEPNAGKLPYGDKRNFKMNDEGAQGRHGDNSMFNGGSREDYIERYYTNGRNKRSVWTLGPEFYKGAHFAVMPTKLVEPCILAGCPPGGVVLDPFMGSGTVAAVAKRLGRDWLGFELNKDYVELAYKRIDGVQPPLFEVA